jgi:hypothetical protein
MRRNDVRTPDVLRITIDMPEGRRSRKYRMYDDASPEAQAKKDFAPHMRLSVTCRTTLTEKDVCTDAEQFARQNFECQGNLYTLVPVGGISERSL